MPWIDTDHYVLKSGRKVYANCGIIGIGPDLNLSEGYDGGFCTWPIPDWWSKEEKADCLNVEELKEIADMMIVRWQSFRELLK